MSMRASRPAAASSGSWLFVQGHFVRQRLAATSLFSFLLRFLSPSGTARGAWLPVAASSGFNGLRRAIGASSSTIGTVASAVIQNGRNKPFAVVLPWRQSVPVRLFRRLTVYILRGHLAVPAYVLEKFTRYASGVEDIFKSLSGFVLNPADVAATRDFISFSVDLREVHQYIGDSIALNRPERLINLLREQLDLILAEQNVSLPPSML